MIERGELLTVCRQIGSMMEAGVDILRITRVLRAQTENPHLLQAYDALDHDLTMGFGLADAMARAPEVWSPFAVSLVQQGEARNDLAGAFNQIADFMAREESDHAAAQSSSEDDSEDGAPVDGSNRGVSSPLTVIALDGLLDRLQTLGLRSLTLFAGLLLTLASVWWAVEIQFIERRWLNVTLFSVAALFMGGAGVLVQRRLESERRREARCSFCGVYSPNGEGLERAPRFQGAAICPRCAAIIARRYGEIDEAKTADAKGVEEKSKEPARNGTAPVSPKVSEKTTVAPSSDWAEAEETYD
ncbi:MAG TPA: type II secretion system F family protein [Abditibacteriaceae bacterium]|jgi:hypothetical protein